MQGTWASVRTEDATATMARLREAKLGQQMAAGTVTRKPQSLPTRRPCCGDDLDACILGLEKAVGSAFYRNILREYGRVNQPKLIRDAAIKRKVLQMLESATRGFDRLEAVTKRLEPNTVEALLANLQAPPLREIADIKTLQNVVLGLEDLADPNRHSAA